MTLRSMPRRGITNRTILPVEGAVVGVGVSGDMASPSFSPVTGDSMGDTVGVGARRWVLG